ANSRIIYCRFTNAVTNAEQRGVGTSGTAPSMMMHERKSDVEETATESRKNLDAHRNEKARKTGGSKHANPHHRPETWQNARGSSANGKH
ncbi:MAG: hypothetical protein RBT80_16145, partial [Candidatus Vecturithrix sp.]|nr:hypothetical protein [Candidatus Vecturithrix sp.]